MMKYFLVIPFLLMSFFILHALGVEDVISISVIVVLVVIYLLLALITHFIKSKKKT